MIGIIAAMNVEMESFRSFIQDPRSETIAGISFVSGTIDGKEVVTAVGGIGKVAQSRYDTLTGIQYGRIEDKFGWIVKL